MRARQVKMRGNGEAFTHESLASLSQMVQSAAGVRTRLALLQHACQLTRPHRTVSSCVRTSRVLCTEILNKDQMSHLTAAELSVYARALSLGVHHLPYVHINHIPLLYVCQFVRPAFLMCMHIQTTPPGHTVCCADAHAGETTSSWSLSLTYTLLRSPRAILLAFSHTRCQWIQTHPDSFDRCVCSKCRPSPHSPCSSISPSSSSIQIIIKPRRLCN